MNETLNGKWFYSSFRHEPIVLKNGQVDGNPELATPWSPPGVMEVLTNEKGEVTGTLTFPPGVALKISGKITPATDNAPASVELTGEGLSSVNKLKGFFVPGSDHVVGTIMCVANDLLKQPNGTLGPFVLFSAKQKAPDVKDTLTITRRGKSMTAELYAPAGATARGVVIIAYGSDGLTDNLSGPWATMIRGYAHSLVEKGFIAIIPDYLAVSGTSPGLEVFSQMLFRCDEWAQAISDTIDHAKTLPMVDASRIGLLGFSLGGHLCLRVRAKAKVLVEFFAPMLEGIGKGDDGILTHAQIHHGEADNVPGTGFPNATPIADTLKREGAATELFPYPGAGHGFIGDDANNTKARELSKERTLAFFQSRL